MNKYIASAQKIDSAFEKKRKQYGGKIAGLSLLEKLIYMYEQENSNEYDFSLNNVPSFSVDLHVFERYEKFLDLHIGDDFNKLDLKRNLLKKKLEFILNSTSVTERFFEKYYQDFTSWIKNNKISSSSWHFRSSTTGEDWIKKEFYGSLPSVCISNNSYENIDLEIMSILDRLDNHDSNDINALSRLWEEKRHGKKMDKHVFYDGIFRILNDFYILRKLNPEELLEEKISISIMPTILAQNKNAKELHSTVYSSTYSKEDSPTRIELIDVQEYSFLENKINPLQLIECDEKEIRVFTSTDIETYRNSNIESIYETYQEKNPYTINEKHCALPKSQLKYLRQFSKFCEKKLGFSVDIESIIINDSYYSNQFQVYPVQIRPILIEIKKQNIDIPDDAIVLRKTPYVSGIFEHHRKLLDRRGYFPIEGINNQNYFIPYSQRSKYSSLVKITLDASTALSHDMEFLPSAFRTWSSVHDVIYEPSRKNYCQIGFIGGDKELYKFINQNMYSKNKLHIEYSLSPMNLSVKSDGRWGVIYITKQQQELFEKTPRRPIPQEYIDYFQLENIPF